jgi:hypothetical protein
MTRIGAGQRLPVRSQVSPAGDPDVAGKLTDPPSSRLDTFIIHDAIRQTGVARHQPCDTDPNQCKRHPVGLKYIADPAALQ